MLDCTGKPFVRAPSASFATGGVTMVGGGRTAH